MKTAHKAAKEAEHAATKFLNLINAKFLLLPTPNEIPHGSTPGALLDWAVNEQKHVRPLAEIGKFRPALQAAVKSAEDILDEARVTGDRLIKLAEYISGESNYVPAGLLPPELVVAAKTVREAARTGAADSKACSDALKRDVYVGLSEVLRLRSKMIPRWRDVGFLAISKNAVKYLDRCAAGQQPADRRKTLNYRDTFAKLADERAKNYAAAYGRDK